MSELAKWFGDSNLSVVRNQLELVSEADYKRWLENGGRDRPMAEIVLSPVGRELVKKSYSDDFDGKYGEAREKITETLWDSDGMHPRSWMFFQIATGESLDPELKTTVALKNAVPVLDRASWRSVSRAVDFGGLMDRISSPPELREGFMPRVMNGGTSDPEAQFAQDVLTLEVLRLHLLKELPRPSIFTDVFHAVRERIGI